MRFLAASSLFFAAPLMAQVFPEVEPNDTVAAAQVVALGSQINGSFTTTDAADWYTFTTTGGYHSIQVMGDATTSAATAVDTVMDIFDASGTTLLAWCDDSGSISVGSPAYLYVSYSSFFGVIPAGTYTIRIKPFSAPTATVTYALNMGLAASKPYTATEVEPNGTIATANVVADGAQIDASIGAVSPVAYTDSVAAVAVVATGTVTSSTTTVITTSGLLNGAYNGVGYFVRCTSGANAGLLRNITANTATTVTTSAWPVAPAAGDTFEVVTNSATIYTGAVTSSTTTVITTSPNLVTSLFTSISNSCAVRCTSGANAGLSRTISANTFNTITTAAWPVAPAAGDTFVVVAGGTAGVAALTTPIASGAINAGDIVRFTSGLNVGLTRVVAAVLPGAITFTSNFTNIPLPGDAFEVDRVDADVYRFDVTAPKALVAFSVTDGTLPWVSGWSYEVMDAAGVRVASTFYGTALADSGAFTNRVASYRVLPTGTWYVRIFQRRSLPSTSTPVLTTGNYRFEVKIRDMNTGGTVAETEPVGTQSNNTVASAQPINPGQLGVGNVTNSAGADPADLWGPLTIGGNGNLITFQVTAAATGTPMTDSTVELIQLQDPIAGTLGTPTTVTNGNILEAANLNPRGNYLFSVPTAQYYLRVVSPGTGVGQSGDYNLEVTNDLPYYLAANYGTASANASGCGTTGVPTIGRVGTTELPVVGQTFVQRVINLNGLGNLGLMVVGVSGALGPSGAPAGSPASIYNPQGLDLTLLGAPGCTLNVNPLDIQVLIGDVTGTVDYPLTIPGNTALSGFTMFFQPCKWDFATPVNALGIQPGTWSRIIVGVRTFL